MPHVTFIHGISNKPPADDLLRIWCNALANATEPLPLGDLGVTSSMVYWADLLYEKPEEDSSAYEGVLENTAEAIDGAGDAPLPVPRTPQEAAFLKGLRARLTTLSDKDLATTEPPPVPAEPQGALERVPLPWFIKKRFLNAHLRDVHHSCAMFTITCSTSNSPCPASRRCVSSGRSGSGSSRRSVPLMSARRISLSRTAWAL